MTQSTSSQASLDEVQARIDLHTQRLNSLEHYKAQSSDNALFGHINARLNNQDNQLQDLQNSNKLKNETISRLTDENKNLLQRVRRDERIITAVGIFAGITAILALQPYFSKKK